jgi:hypothetical protein
MSAISPKKKREDRTPKGEAKKKQIPHRHSRDNLLGPLAGLSMALCLPFVLNTACTSFCA